jgi:hypothetical protein
MKDEREGQTEPTFAISLAAFLLLLGAENSLRADDRCRRGADIMTPLTSENSIVLL